MFDWLRGNKLRDENERLQAEVSTLRTKAAGDGSLIADVGVGGGGGMPRVNLSGAREQLQHFRGWQFVAIRAIATRIAGQSLFIGRKGVLAGGPSGFKTMSVGLEPLARHELLDAIDDPNPWMTRWSLLFVTVCQLQLTGRAFWWLSELEGGGLQIFPLPAHWLTPENGNWRARPPGSVEGFFIASDDLAQFLLPDPADPMGGAVSPLATQSDAINADESIQRAQYAAFRNSTTPGLIIKAGRLPGMDGREGMRPTLTAEQRTQLIGAIKRGIGGVSRHGEPIILDGMIEDVTKFTLTPAEMDFLQSGKATKARIFQAFGVNPLLVGEIEGANRAQAVVAENSFCQNVINPLLTLMAQTLTQWVASRWADNLVMWFDIAKANDADDEFRYFALGFNGGAVTLNELRTKIGLPGVPWGDEPKAPSTGQQPPEIAEEVKAMLSSLDPYRLERLDHA